MTEKKNNVKVYIVIGAVLLLGIFVFVMMFRNISDSRNYDKYISSAKTSISESDFDSALAYLRKAGAIDQTDECLLLMVQCYEAQSNFEKALEALRQLDTTNPQIASRIAADEARLRALSGGSVVTIGGKDFNSTDTSVILDNLGLDDAAFSAVSQIYAVSNLSAAGNNITSISPLASLGGLTTLNLNNNQISNLAPLASLVSLRTLYLDNNPVSDFSPLYSLPNLTFLSVKGVQMKESDLATLSYALPNCAINGADAQEESQLIALGGVTFSVDVSEPLDLSYRGINDISALSQCTKLTSVNLRGNDITDISPLMDIQYLSYVDISENNVSDIRPLMGVNGLKSLYASDNNISSTVSLSASTSLMDLKLDNNPISNFSGLAKLKNLTNLSLRNTGMKQDDIKYFQLMSKLVSLDISDNPGITGETYDRLRTLLPSCEITTSDLTYSLDFAGMKVSSNAKSIDMPNCGVTDLSILMQLNMLESVNLANNAIDSLYYFSVTESWRTLKSLNLSGNNINDLTALQSLKYLETLNLTDNNITDITPLYAMDSLRELYIGANPLSEDQIRDLNNHLPNCTIIDR